MGSTQRKVERGVYEMPVGSGRFFAVWKDALGRRHRKYGGTRQLARAVYQKAKLDALEGRLFPDSPRLKNSFTWAQLCAEFKKAHPKHWSLHNGNFRRIESWWPRIAIGMIGPAQIQAKLAEIESDGRRSTTANRYRAVLGAIFGHAERGGMIPANPVRRVKPRREDGQVIRFLGAEEEARLLHAIGLFYPSHAPEVILALHTGMRRGEQYGLRWEDVDRAAQTISIRRSKSGKPRFLPINAAAAKALEELRRPARETVCPQQSPRSWFERCCAAAEVLNFRWHDLRHTFASRLAMNGVSLRAIQELLGHSQITTTMRYAHLAPGYTRDAVMALGATAGDTEENGMPRNRLKVVEK